MERDFRRDAPLPISFIKKRGSAPLKNKYDSIVNYLKSRIEQTEYGVLTEISIMYQELEDGTLPPDIGKALFLLDSAEESRCLEELLHVQPKEKIKEATSLDDRHK